jgi:small subunit ribosomal protein S20
MPHHKATKKSLVTDAAKRTRNRMIKSRCRTLEKNYLSALEEGNKEQADTNLKIVQKALDQAVTHGILKKETVSRKKSRLMKSINKPAAA